MKHLTILFLITFYISFSACKNDNCNQVFFGGSTIFNEEIADVNEAFTAFSDDMSTENCENYRASVRAFLDKRIEFRDCVTADDIVRYDMEIDGLEDLLNGLNC